MDDKELSALKALAEAATPGPWVDGYHTVYQDDNIGGEEICRRMSVEDSSYIAAANPDAILSLISRLEQAETASAERANNAIDQTILSMNERSEQGGNTSIDLSGLTRYAASDYITRIGEMVESDDGEYVKLSDVQALLATPARDVGGLTGDKVAQLWSESKGDSLREITRNFAAAIEREVLTTSPAPSVKQEAVAWGLLSIQEPELTNDAQLAAYWSRKGRVVTPLFAAPSASQGEVSGWISVKDRLPELHVAVALLNEDGWMNTGGDFDINWQACGWLCEFGRKYWSVIGETRAMTLDSVTHWMPLPAAPAPSVMDGETK